MKFRRLISVGFSMLNFDHFTVLDELLTSGAVAAAAVAQNGHLQKKKKIIHLLIHIQ